MDEQREAGKEAALREMVGVTLGMPETLVKETEPKWAIQGGSFVMRNTPWALETMDTIHRESGSMLTPRPPHTLVPWSTLSDRAQWIRWAYLHRSEARKHMAILPGRAFNSMGADYAVGDLVQHAGGGGAFENRYFRSPFKTDTKYAQLLVQCDHKHAQGDKALPTTQGGATRMSLDMPVVVPDAQSMPVAVGLDHRPCTTAHGHGPHGHGAHVRGDLEKQ